MFAFGLKGRTAEVIRRASYALMLGDFIDKKELDQSELDAVTQSMLFFHTAANCLFALYMQFQSSIANDQPWATLSFFMEHVAEGLERFEAERNLEVGTLAQQILPVLGSVGGFAEQHRQPPHLFSVDEITKFDADTDEEGVEDFIVDACGKYFSATRSMFTPR